MSLTVIATITAKEDAIATVHEALTALVVASRGDEGCLSYELYQGTTDPAVFMTVESWESQAAIDGHMQAPHLGAAVQAAGPHLAKPFEIVTLASVEA